jgi:hypothetical protein
MEKSLIISLLRLKLEALDLVVDSLPEPVKTQAADNSRELIEMVHRLTGEYLTREKADISSKNTLKNVDIK